jgi:myo-inositol 2-dehydrogenase/D-chiro-inositol 1-dehydrogenase
MENLSESRRDFIKMTALATGAILVNPHILKASNANSAIRIGFLGCGARGTSVATAMVNNTNSRIVAIADLFEDQLLKAADHWNDVARQKGYAGIDPKLMFKGPDAYKQIANCSEVDMILLSTPDYFHPQHLAEVVKAGKHVYCEKPAGVDVEGCLDFIRTGESALGRLSLDVGFNVREAPCFSEVVNRIQQGAIGNVSYGSIHYHASAITYPEYPKASPLERRIRQFYWDKVLTGDTIVDQDIHVIDMTNWVLGSHPVKAIGVSGRKVRKDAGNIQDNWSVSYTYPGDVHISLSAVQFGDFWDVGVRYIGDKGMGESNYNGFARITGDQPWSSALIREGGDFSTAGTFNGLGNADANKARKFIDSIVSGNYHNQAREGAESALAAILGRMAAYEGCEVTWDEMIKSKQSYKDEIDLTKL